MKISEILSYLGSGDNYPQHASSFSSINACENNTLAGFNCEGPRRFAMDQKKRPSSRINFSGDRGARDPSADPGVTPAVGSTLE